MTTIGNKTRAAARKAAHRDLGANAIEGVDFTLRNTGATWVAVPIAPVTDAAKVAQAKRHAHPTSAQVTRAKAAAAAPKVAAESRAIPKKAKPAPKPAAPQGQTKTDMILAMISTKTGATSKEMEAATGWAPHSVRGLLGALRAKGVNVVSKKLQGQPTVYRIVKTKKAAQPPAQDVGDVI